MSVPSDSSSGVDRRLLAEWRARLDHLHELARVAPQSEWQWLWATRQRIIGYLLARYGEDDLSQSGIETHQYVSPRDLHLAGESNEPYATRPTLAAPTVPPGMGKALRTTGALRGVLERTRHANEGRYVDWSHAKTRLIEEYEKAMLEAPAPGQWRRRCESILRGQTGAVGLSARQLYYAALAGLAMMCTAVALNRMIADEAPSIHPMLVVSLIAGVGGVALAGGFVIIRRGADTADPGSLEARRSARRYRIAAAAIALLTVGVLLTWLGVLAWPVIAYPQMRSAPPGQSNRTVGFAPLSSEVSLDELYRMRTRFKIDESIDERGPVFRRLAAGVATWRHQPESMTLATAQSLLGPPDFATSSRLAYTYRDEAGSERVIVFIFQRTETVYFDLPVKLFDPTGWYRNRVRRWDVPPRSYAH